jgi:biofilm protein TabA
MAVFGPFLTVRDQLIHDVRFAAAFAYVGEMLSAGSAARTRIGRIAAGVTERIELAGGSFALEQVYHTKTRPEGFFETHRKYIDVQVIVEGAEWMELVEAAQLTIAEGYNETRDLIKYADITTASLLKLGAGDIAVFFPEDGHMPGLRPEGRVGLVRKTVVKVPVA